MPVRSRHKGRNIEESGSQTSDIWRMQVFSCHQKSAYIRVGKLGNQGLFYQHFYQHWRLHYAAVCCFMEDFNEYAQKDEYPKNIDFTRKISILKEI